MSARAFLGAVFLWAAVVSAAEVPRPEHPRPDRMRAEWQTLNGAWEFDFDEADRGLAEGWFRGARPLSRTILVPTTTRERAPSWPPSTGGWASRAAPSRTTAARRSSTAPRTTGRRS